MNRNPVELELSVRAHATRLEREAEDRRRSDAVAPSRPLHLGHVQRAVGLGLIRVGQRLTGETAVPAVGAPRPAA